MGKAVIINWLNRLIWCGVLAVVTMAGGSAANAQNYSSQVSLEINRVYAKMADSLPPGYSAVIVTVENKSPYALGDIWINCTFLRDGSPVATGPGYVVNLMPGAIATEDIWAGEMIRFNSARCRVTRASR